MLFALAVDMGNNGFIGILFQDCWPVGCMLKTWEFIVDDSSSDIVPIERVLYAVPHFLQKFKK